MPRSLEDFLWGNKRYQNIVVLQRQTDDGSYQWAQEPDGDYAIASRDPLFWVFVLVPFIASVLLPLLWWAVALLMSWNMIVLGIGSVVAFVGSFLLVQLGLYMWRTHFHMIQPFVIAAVQLRGYRRYYRECWVFMHPNYTEHFRFRYANDVIDLNGAGGAVAAEVQHRKIDPSDPDEEIRITTERFEINVTYCLAVQDKQHDNAGWMGMVARQFFDNFTNVPTDTVEQMEIAQKRFVTPEIKQILSDSMDAAMQILHSPDTPPGALYLEDIKANRNLVTDPLMRVIEMPMLAQGILVRSIRIGEVLPSPSTTAIENRAIAHQQSAERIQVSAANLAAQTIELNNEKTIVEKRQEVEDQRIALAEKEAQTALQQRMKELELYRRKGDLNAEVVRSFAENSSIGDTSGLILLARELGLPDLAKALKAILGK